MDSEGCHLTCTVMVEWTNAQGTTTRKVSYRSAQLRILRNNFRQMLIEIKAEKANTTIRLALKGINVLNRYMNEGKSTIKFAEERCTLFMSNAPAAQLITFLKTIFVKMTGQPEAVQAKNPLKERILGTGKLGGVQDISPATNAEVSLAKEKAMLVAESRKTVTTPSPGAIRKRKLTEANTPKIPIAKKLYANPTLPLTDEQKGILDAVLKGRNIFFTGSAGTGKSFLLKRIISELPPSVTSATASTGVAACHIGGITLHQFSGIGLGTGTLERCYQMASRPAVATIWRRTKYLIIDEISMVDGEYFEKIEAVARHVRKSERPFGGIQLILCGDFFQLPPVTKTSIDTKKFCFQTKAWVDCVHLNFELETVHRQKDPKFIKVLNSLRIGRVTDEIATILKSTSSQKIEKDGIMATRLCSHVREANEINESQLGSLKGIPKTYVAQDSDELMSKTLDQQLTVPGKLVLKVGAQVMLLKNINISNGLVNGARGVIVKFEAEVPVVQFRFRF